MTAIFYMSSLIFSMIGLFALWQLGLKRLMLDDFRDSLFVTRDRLYSLTKEQRISCDDKAYRSVESFVNLTIRYAHRFTFLSFAFSVWHMDEVKEAAAYNQRSQIMMKAVASVKDDAVRRELNTIIDEVTTLLPRYIAKTSLMFMFSSVIYFTFRSVSPLVARSKAKAVKTFEIEAYRDASLKGLATV
jgi:hypothetical protein